MKRFLSLILVVSMSLMVFAGCTNRPSSDDRLKIVVTVFPIYDWVRNIMGDDMADADVTLLMNSGTDMHSFQPTVKDIMTISECDLFIYVGGESDEWVEDALKEATNKDMTVVNLLDELGDRAKEEEAIPGIGEDEEEEEGEGIEYDEHIWLSLKNANICCEAIESALIKVDPDHTDDYRVNTTSYRGEISALDTFYEETISECPGNTLLFGDRFPFRYLVEDYGLDYYAAFSGCSAETEASFETIIFLSGIVDEFGLKTVLKIDGSNDRIPQSIIDNSRDKDQSIMTLDSMQSVTAADIEAGTTYLGVMQSNLDVIKAALS